MSQPVTIIGRKTSPEPIMEVLTPIGTLAFQRGMSIRREWGFETLAASVEVEGVKASVRFHLDGSDEDDVPTTLRVAFLGGVERWMTPHGEPIEHEGRKVAWHCGAELDLRTATPGTLSCSLSEFDPPKERRVIGIMAPMVRDEGLSARLERAVGEILDRWARDDRGYVARVYAAMMRVAQADLEGLADQARLDLLATLGRRDRAARFARMGETAAKLDARHWPPSEIESDAERPHVELRGFGGEDAVDGRNLDEVVVVAPAGLHVETMSDEHTWMGVYLADGRRLVVNFTAEGGKLVVGAEIDDEGN